MNTFINKEEFNKKNVIFIMGAIGTGKSRLSVDLATHFLGEIINSDKMQVYKGLEIDTNKITHTEKQEDRVFKFKYKYDICFIWIDVEQSVLNRRVDIRVDQMVKEGLVDEVRHIFILDADYTKGIRRSIGVPEMDIYLMEETNIDVDDESEQMILQTSISTTINKRENMVSASYYCYDVFEEDREEDHDEAWTNTVLQPCLDIEMRFLKNGPHNIIIERT
ncbi:hypothetical protein EJD97_023739 [Solanum chilense]|uniref:Uncharacterized protein n=1 Tax=Solanum chilense TaxID=4083 RepID=A0A6N2C3I2_SOLCI|nr:hypothetical protein EJD97_023739 [Solanum chilense]